MNKNTIFNLHINCVIKNSILEKIIKALKEKKSFFHIVSLNPENIVIAKHDQKYENVLSQSDIKIVDGVGLVLAARILGINIGERVTGVDLMQEILQTLKGQRLHILLIGGRAGLAEKLAECYLTTYPSLNFKGCEGYVNIGNPKPSEDAQLFETIEQFKPDIIFAAYGSPQQELWFDRHKAQLHGIVCMGVGGGFDFISGSVSRAPVLVRQIGLEWLYRLFQQPWRWKRQLKLFEFISLVYNEKFYGKR